MLLFYDFGCNYYIIQIVLFDVQRQPCLDASLIVIGQTLMDAFSRSSLPLGKESPSSKLLFAKEISRYRPVAQQMFKRLSRRDHFTQQQLHRNTLLMGQHSLPKVSHNNNNNKKSFEINPKDFFPQNGNN